MTDWEAVPEPRRQRLGDLLDERNLDAVWFARPNGFAGREWIASPGATDPVQLPMAYAWNPTVQGAKSEGTVLVTGDGYEPLTAGSWPTRASDAVGYSLGMERPDILGADRA